MRLFARTPVDEVTVQHIAASVDVTPAAVYYHFASKEQILVEGMTHFRDAMLAELRDRLPVDGDESGVRVLLAAIVEWTARHRTAATVYFVSSIGLNLLVEALRRETRIEMVGLLRAAVLAARGRTSSAEAGVIAVALVSLIETAVASMLNHDEAFRVLGARRFAVEVGAIGDRIAGIRDVAAVEGGKR
jgi:AcrR family transcriptional regulator